MSNIFEKLEAARTMPELDALRQETFAAMEAAGVAQGAPGFEAVQKAFIKAKNRLKRIPRKDRTW